MLGLGIACVISAAAWVYLIAAHGGFWLTSQRLPPSARRYPAPPGEWPPVAAVVPARNEAESLPATLPALLAQDYPGGFRVFLVDDDSDDGTGAIAADLGDKAARAGGAPLTVIKGQPRPDGWAGKVWAMAQGFAAATRTAEMALDANGAGKTAKPDRAVEAGGTETETRGDAAVVTVGTDAAAEASATSDPGAPPEYVLFTDADIHWTRHALRDLVRSAGADDRALVSQMALLRAQTRWERVIVPAFVYFFAQLYPFRRVSAPESRTAGAAGGCMLIRRAALVDAGGFEQMRGALIDDVALGTLLKRRGNRIWLGLTRDVRSARPYPDLASLWHMITRSAYVQLRYNPLLLAGTITGLLVLYVAPVAGAIVALIVAGNGDTGSATVLAGAAGLVGWALMTVSYVPMLRFYGLSAFRAPTLPLIAALYAAMTADSARRHYSGRAVSWRGRTAARVKHDSRIS